jgi:hypothetical protein
VFVKPSLDGVIGFSNRHLSTLTGILYMPGDSRPRSFLTAWSRPETYLGGRLIILNNTLLMQFKVF